MVTPNVHVLEKTDIFVYYFLLFFFSEPNPYPTITSPVKLRNPTEYNPSSHLARPNPVSPSALNPAKPGQSMMQVRHYFARFYHVLNIISF